MIERRPSPQFPLTETGDAEFFAEHFGDEVKYDHRRGRWLIFAGHRWHDDANGELHRLAIESMRGRQQHSITIHDLERKKAHAVWAIRGESRQRLENMLALAKNVEPISDNGEGWDSDPWLLGCQNGIYDISIGKLRAGVPEDRITMAVNANYDPDAQCPEWCAMIDNVFADDEGMALYIQCALGYSLTGITREQCLFLNTGKGGNGKGTMLNTIGWLLGDYADELPFASLEKQARGVISNDIAGIVGKRFVTASESKKGIAWDEARLKQLTGCDQVRARFLHHEFFTFTPVAKFWLSCNDKPNVEDNSDGFWRRMKVIPWTRQFSDSIQGARADDKELKERLRHEGDGILAWLIWGCREGWHAMKGLKVMEPKSIREATEEYRRESDALAPFIDAHVTESEKGRVGAGQFYDTYNKWTQDMGTSERALSPKYFGIWAKKNFKWMTESNKATTYLGITVR